MKTANFLALLGAVGAFLENPVNGGVIEGDLNECGCNQLCADSCARRSTWSGSEDPLQCVEQTNDEYGHSVCGCSSSSDRCMYDNPGFITSVRKMVIFDGDFVLDETVTNATDITVINGNLRIAPGVTCDFNYVFPQLQQINGNLWIDLRNNENIVSFNAPELMFVAGNVRFTDTAIEEINMPNLIRIGLNNTMESNFYAFRNRKLTSVSFPSLDTVEGDFNLRYNTNLKSADMPSLYEVQGDVNSQDNFRLEVLNLSSLESLGNSIKIDQNNIAEFKVPKLTHVTGQIYINTCSLLREIDFSGMTNVGDLRLDDLNSLESLRLDSLARIAGPLYVGCSRICANGIMRSLQELNAPQLTQVDGYILIDDNEALRSIDFSGLEAVGGDVVWINRNPSLEHINMFSTSESSDIVLSNEEFHIQGNPKLTNIDFPRVSQISGWVSLSENENLEFISMPNLRIADTVDFSISDNTNMKYLNMPNLEYIAGDLILFANTLLETLNFDSLKEFGGAGPKFEFYFQGSHNLKELNLPSLETVVGQIAIRGCDQLEVVDLPALSLVGKRLYVTDLPVLQNLELPTSSWIGEFEFIDNAVFEELCLTLNTTESCISPIDSGAWTSAIAKNQVKVCNTAKVDNVAIYQNEQVDNVCNQWGENCECIGTKPHCSFDRNTWDGGSGGCDTYGPDGVNRNYCEVGYAYAYAFEVCSECNRCLDN